MASNNQKCVWVYAIGYELVHYFQTAEEADVWWASYKVEVGDDVEGAIEQVFQKLPPSPTTTPDETVELDVEKLEFEGNTYLKDDDENVYKNIGEGEGEKIGVWDEENERIEFDDDNRCLVSEHFTAKKCYSVRAEYNPSIAFKWAKFNGKICAGCWAVATEGQKKLDEQSTEEQNADIKDMLRKSLKGSPLVKNLSAELRKRGVTVEDLRRTGR